MELSLIVYVVFGLILWPLVYRWSYRRYINAGFSWDDSDRNFHVLWSFAVAVLWPAFVPMLLIMWFVVKVFVPLFKKLEN